MELTARFVAVTSMVPLEATGMDGLMMESYDAGASR